MTMLDMFRAGIGLHTLKGVTYLTLELCFSIGTPPELITLIHAAYAIKVNTKPYYIIMAREMIFNVIIDLPSL